MGFFDNLAENREERNDTTAPRESPDTQSEYLDRHEETRRRAAAEERARNKARQSNASNTRDVRRQARRLEHMGGEVPDTTETPFWKKALGTIDVVSAPVRSQNYQQAASAVTDKDKPFFQRLARQAVRSIPFDAATRIGQGIGVVDRSKIYGGETGIESPIQAGINATRGEFESEAYKAAEGDTFLGDFGVKEGIGRTVAGAGLDIATSPDTYLSGGYTAATKADAATEMIEMASKVVDLGEISAKYGDDVTRAVAGLGDDTLRAIGEGGVKYADLPKDVARMMHRSTLARMGAGQAGKARTLGVPFLRKTDDGVKAGLRHPWIRKIPENEVKMLEFIGDGSLASWWAKTIGYAPTMITYADEAWEAGDDLIRLGTRSADAGGLKFAGATTIGADGATARLGRVLKDNAKQMKVFQVAGQLVNPFYEIDKIGNEFYSQGMRGILKESSGIRNLGNNMAKGRFKDRAQYINDTDAADLAFGIDRTLPDEIRSVVSDKTNQLNRLELQTQRILENRGVNDVDLDLFAKEETSENLEKLFGDPESVIDNQIVKTNEIDDAIEEIRAGQYSVWSDEYKVLDDEMKLEAEKAASLRADLRAGGWDDTANASNARARRGFSKEINDSTKKQLELNTKMSGLKKQMTSSINTSDVVDMIKRRAIAGERRSVADALVGRASRSLDLAVQKRIESRSLMQSIDDLVSSNLSRDNVENYLREIGRNEDDISRIMLIHDDMIGRNAQLNKMLDEMDVGGSELFTGHGSQGYMKMTEPERTGVIRQGYDKARSAIDNAMGKDDVIRGNSLNRSRKEVLRREGFPTEGYERASDAKRETMSSTQRLFSTDRVRPDLEQMRVTDGLRDRLGKNMATQIDSRIAAAAKENEVYGILADAKLENDVMGMVGRKLNKTPTKASLDANGEVLYTVKRMSGDVEYAIPRSADNWIKALDNSFKGGEAAGSILRGYDNLMGFWKRMATSLNIRFHVRNGMSNYFMAWSDDMGDIRGWQDGFRVLTRDEGSYKVAGEVMDGEKLRKEMMEFQVIKGEFGPAEIQDQLTRGMDASRTLWGKVSRAGDAAGGWTEDMSRASVYINARNKGMSQLESARQVDRTLYNYGSEALTSFERNVMKRAVPFYSWMRNNIPATMRRIAKNPGKQAGLLRAQRGMWDALGSEVDIESLPGYKQDTVPVKLPNGDIILVQPSMITTMDLSKVTDSNSLISQLTPMLGFPLEEIFGKDSFTGADLGEKERANGAIQWVDSVLYGNQYWEGLKDKLGMTERIDRYGDQNAYIAAPGRTSRFLDSAFPVVRSYGKGLDVYDEDQPFNLAAIAGLKAYPYDKQSEKEQATYRQLRAIEDELSEQRKDTEIRR